MELIQSDRVSSHTRDVLLARLEPKGPQSIKPFASPRDYQTLELVCRLLVPQEGDDVIDLAALVTEDKRAGIGNGWRYANMPSDSGALVKGVSLLDVSSIERFEVPFAALQSDGQLILIADGVSGDLNWETLDPALWFEELLSDLVQAYVSHPSTMSQMGFDGFAFLPEWSRIGLNSREPWELVTE